MATGYTLVSQGRSDMGTFCQHCGRFIFNYAYVKSRFSGNMIRVGLDCMQALCNTGIKENRKQLKLF